MTKPILFNTDMVRALLEGRKTVTRRVVKEQEPDWEFVSLENDPYMTRIDRNGEEYPSQETGLWATFEWEAEFTLVKSPYQPGDILYVRETFQIDYLSNIPGSGRIRYKADDTYSDFTFAPERYDMMRQAQLKPGWRPNENMPREAARIFLRVTDVRVERLWAVEAEDVLAEGVTPTGKSGGCRCQWAFDGCMDGPCSNRTAYEIERYIVPFAQLWDSTIKPADRAIYGWDANPWVWVIEFERCEKPEEKVEPC